MSITRFITVTTILAFICIAGQQRPATENPAMETLRPWILDELSQTISSLHRMQEKGHNIRRLQSYYNDARQHYKQIECFIEYCSPREAKFFINGPLVPKHDEEQGKKMLEPNGFQRIEELIYADDVTDTAELNKTIRQLETTLSDIKAYYHSIDLPDGVLLEMCQLELFRIAAMNLNGYDATLSLTNVTESFYCLEGIRRIITVITEAHARSATDAVFSRQLTGQLDDLCRYLQKHRDYNTLDRLYVITHFINPVNTSIVSLHNSTGLPWSTHKQALFLNRTLLFGDNNFNDRFFSIYYDDTVNISLQAALGKLLFHDPLLSSDNSRSCAHCHDPAKAFSDGLAGSKPFGSDTTALRNAPTLFNVVYQKAFFTDGRAYQLEQQVSDVVHNAHEMNGSLEQATLRLRNNRQYRLLFCKAFAGTPDSIITTYAIKKAITEYENTLVSFNSRFDQYLKGIAILSPREINGYNIFAGKALCGSCHFLPLFNGTVPPFYTDSEFEVIGTPDARDTTRTDPDPGRYAITGIEAQRHAFKTPTVRNVSITAPYMHNGAYNTLEEIIEFYHKGGGKGLGLNYPNQTLPFDSLKLTPVEKEDIVLFMQTLTDTTSYKKLRVDN